MVSTKRVKLGRCRVIIINVVSTTTCPRAGRGGSRGHGRGREPYCHSRRHRAALARAADEQSGRDGAEAALNDGNAAVDALQQVVPRAARLTRPCSTG